MRADLELVARRLVDVRRPQYVVALDLRRQGHGTLDDGAGALRRLDDLERRLVDQLVIERLQSNSDALVLHVLSLGKTVRTMLGFSLLLPDEKRRAAPSLSSRLHRRKVGFHFAPTNYSMIFATTPAPTVRPPSRMAKRNPSSIAIGAISVTVIWMLSPGITISVPDGNSTLPVTSVVRK